MTASTPPTHSGSVLPGAHREVASTTPAPQGARDRPTDEYPTVRVAPAPYRPLVLVVDDHDDVRTLVCEFLRQAGVDTIPARSVCEARALLGALTVDVVVTDYSMPGDTGLSLLTSIAEDPRQIGGVLMTGHEPRAELAESARAVGAAFVPKPFTLGQLITAIEQTISDSSGTRWPSFRGVAANSPE